MPFQQQFVFSQAAFLSFHLNRQRTRSGLTFIGGLLSGWSPCWQVQFLCTGQITPAWSVLFFPAYLFWVFICFTVPGTQTFCGKPSRMIGHRLILSTLVSRLSHYLKVSSS